METTLRQVAASCNMHNVVCSLRKIGSAEVTHEKLCSECCEEILTV